jgi:hypothetical protein
MTDTPLRRGPLAIHPGSTIPLSVREADRYSVVR